MKLYRVVAVAVSIIIVVASCIPQISRKDGDPYLFLEASRRLIHDQDLYYWVSPHGNSYYYPPFFALALFPLTIVPPAIVIFLWAIASVVLLGWSMTALLSALTEKPFSQIDRRTRWVVLGLTTLLNLRFVLLHLRFGQTNILLLAMMVLGMVWMARGAKLAAGLAMGFSIILKLLTAPFGVWLLMKRQAKILLGIALAVFVGIALPIVAVGFWRDIEIHREWLKMVALAHSPGTGNWAGVGDISIRAQLDRFFLKVPAFPYHDAFYRVTLIELPHGVVRVLGYAAMIAVIVAIIWFQWRFRKAPELVSLWAGAAFVFSLLPSFSTITEIPHLVLLVPSYLYVVYIWHERLIVDRSFKWLVVLSFIFTSLTTRGLLGVFTSRLLTAWGFISLGILLLSAAIVRAALVMSAATDNRPR